MRISDWSSDVCSSDLLGIKSQIRNVPCGKISRRKLRHECPVDDCVVLENYTLSDVLLRHLTPDGEVAGIAAKLTFGERSSLVAFDRRGVIAEPFGQIGACFDKPPGHACARGAGRKGGSALHCVGHGYDENRTGKFCISHNAARISRKRGGEGK